MSRGTGIIAGVALLVTACVGSLPTRPTYAATVPLLASLTADELAIDGDGLRALEPFVLTVRNELDRAADCDLFVPFGRTADELATALRDDPGGHPYGFQAELGVVPAGGEVAWTFEDGQEQGGYALLCVAGTDAWLEPLEIVLP